jgi:hypothetical protein
MGCSMDGTVKPFTLKLSQTVYHSVDAKGLQETSLGFYVLSKAGLSLNVTQGVGLG